ncbi:MAG: hypothetical protein M0R47_16635 [Methylobacter sp.]|uniref:hypothetical protein n=1 Tax=Methylobacter sp. TaxID=2051955 RepID=UPI0025E111AA|nr:hypothetical protein [Methylobacter sp.]MCK9622149.1 hypothetical protein [Methylobacter sp.]
MAFRVIDRDLERCQDWLGDRTGTIGYDMVQAIGLERDGELVAVTGYNNFIDKSCHIHFAIQDGVVVPRNYLWFIHYYPYMQAGIDVLIAFMPVANERIIRLAQHLGYSLRCWIDDAGLMLYTMNKSNCKWTRIKHGIK